MTASVHTGNDGALIVDEAHAADLSRQVELTLFYHRQLDLRSSRLESGETSAMHACEALQLGEQ
jgi:hypothetical protein